jgi:hypothetical protein
MSRDVPQQLKQLPYESVDILKSSKSTDGLKYI